MKKIIALLFIAILLFGFTYDAKALSIASTFDSDLEGWYSNNDPGSTSHVYEGSNGVMRVEDLKGDSLHIIAPSKFLGDWTNYEKLSMDMKATSWGDDSLYTGSVMFEMTDGVNKAQYLFYNTQTIGDQWMNYSLVLDKNYNAGNWHINGDWDILKSNVTSFSIAVDLVINGGVLRDINYVDNIQLIQSPTPAPEPSSVIFGLASLAGILGLRKKENIS